MQKLSERPYDTDKYKTEWWYDEPVYPEGKGFWLLKVDDESTEEEIEAEMEYWMLQKSLGGTEAGDKAIMAAIRWMMSLLQALA